MEVKPGYKQTEVGVIPEEWGVFSFQEVTEIITCGLAATPTYVLESVGKPFLSAQNVRDGRIVFDNHRFIPTELFEQITRHNKPKRGDLLYTRVGAGIGEAGIVESDVEFGIYVSLTLIRTDSRKLHNGFAAHLLNSTSYRARAKGGQFAGGGVQNLNVEVVRRFPIPLPSSEEQRAIATALSDVDGLLGGLDRLIAKKRDLKQAAMQQLLTGQTRLPGFHGEWEIASLEQLVVKATGVWGAQSPDEGHPRYAEIIRAGDISPNGELTATAPRYLSEAEFAKASCQPDDLVITTSGNGLGKVWWCDGRANVAASNFVRILRPIKTKAEGRFLSYLLRSGEALRQLREHTATSAYPNLRPTFFSASWISLPPLPEQTAIAEVLTEMDAELAGLEQRREKTRALKQAMMQELLTGRTRLVESGKLRTNAK